MLRACMFCVLSSSLALHMGSFAAGAQPPQPLSPRRAPRPSLVAASMSAADASLPGAPQSQEAPAPAPRESTLSQIVMQIRGGDKIRGRTFVLPAIIAALLVGFQITSALGAVAGLYALKLVYAGAIAGIISRSACAPLEMVSTVMMCKGGESGGMRAELKKAWKADGIQGLFKGNGANCLKVAPSRGTQFLVYEYVKRLLVTYGWFGLVPGAPLGALPRLCAGGIAGMVAAVIVYPLEVVKTLRTVFPDECTGIYETIDCVVQKGGGIAGLYRGLVPTLIAMFPYVGVEFMVYETLKRYWEVRFAPPRTVGHAPYPPPRCAPSRRHTTLPSAHLSSSSALQTSTGMAAGTAALLLLGAIGGACAQASAHPLDVVRRRMQMQGVGNIVGDKKGGKAPKKIGNMFQGLYSIGKDEGVGVLFRGLGPACLEKVPSTAIGYYIYEGMKVAMGVKSV